MLEVAKAAAATKIQAVVRGNQVRASVQAVVCLKSIKELKKILSLEANKILSLSPATESNASQTVAQLPERRKQPGIEQGKALNHPFNPQQRARINELNLDIVKKPVEKNEQVAVAWFRKATENGNANAQFNLGVKYQLGRGVAQDYEKAVELYRKAAEQGNAKAQNKLGLIGY